MMNDIGMAAAGGAIIGVASVLLLYLNGRIAGISGIMNGALKRAPGENVWRILFVAGLLVGFGTRLGSGCTSGHGICGISRLSMRSIVATATFVAIGMLTATVIVRMLGVT